MSEEQDWKKYLCRACGLIYDEKLGDPDSGLAPGTRFEDIPDDWECPLCGVTKEDFELLAAEPMQACQGGVQVNSSESIVVIGAGISGWSVVDELKKADPNLPVTLISACSADLYHKPELSIALSKQKSRDQLVQESGVSKAERIGVQLLNHTFVVSVDAQRRCLRTTRGEMSYRYLIIAQGAKASVPSHIPKAFAWRVNHLDSWSALQSKLQESSQRVAILGSGMIGCELAEDLMKAGHEVTLISRDALPLCNLLPDDAAQRYLARLQGVNISFLGSQEILSVEETTLQKKKILLSSMDEIEVDHLIVATGLETDSRLASQAGIDFNHGICVDPNTLKTNNEYIFALGDCISLNGHPCRFIEPIFKQASVIAQQITGSTKSGYAHTPPVIRLKSKVLPIELHGTPIAKDDWKTLYSSDECLVLEQYQEGELSSRLNVGVIPTAFKQVLINRGSQL